MVGASTWTSRSAKDLVCVRNPWDVRRAENRPLSDAERGPSRCPSGRRGLAATSIEVEAKPGEPCPDCGRPTETVTEENLFFKLSAFTGKLIELH